MFIPTSGTKIKRFFAAANLISVVFIGIRVAKHVRPATNTDQTGNIGDTDASTLATNFEEMRIGNDISEAEFRTIKSVLEKKLAD